MACVASLGWCHLKKADYHSFSSTYEQIYNSACISAAQGDYEEAEQLLFQAIQHCRRSLQEQDYELVEIELELTSIVAQLGYVQQKLGKWSKAYEHYQAVLATPQLDPLVAALVHNNLMVIRGNQELFESQKGHRLANQPAVRAKMNSVQRKQVDVNGVILQLLMGKKNNAKQLISQLQETLPLDGSLFLCQVALTTKDPSLSAIQKLVEKTPDILAARLLLVQYHVSMNNFRLALEVLHPLLVLSQFQYAIPGLTSLMLWLYEQLNEPQEALNLLQQVSSELLGAGASQERIQAVSKQVAAFKMKLGRYQEAAKDYEHLVQSNPKDLVCLSQLALAYSAFDTGKALLLEDQLLIESTCEKSVEQLLVLPNRSLTTTSAVKKITKRKRKPKRLPKAFDPNGTPDPGNLVNVERWLPKHQRKSAKKGKSKKDLSKGPQGMQLEGGGIGGTGSARISGMTAKQPEPVVETPTAPTPSIPLSALKSKKKKKNKK